MIDEKKIKEAAEEQFDNVAFNTCPYKTDVINSFKAGINWFKDNLWHDASEEPEIGKRVIAECKCRDGETRFYFADREPKFNWKAEARLTRYTRWLYIEDLLKGGK